MLHHRTTRTEPLLCWMTLVDTLSSKNWDSANAFGADYRSVNMWSSASLTMYRILSRYACSY